MAGGISGRGKASLGWRVGLSLGRIQAGAGAGVGDRWARAGLLWRKEAGLRRGPREGSLKMGPGVEHGWAREGYRVAMGGGRGGAREAWA